MTSSAMKRLLVPALLMLAACVASATAAAADAGEAAPALELPDGDGRSVALDALRGKIVWVDFWASWCGPCKRSFPWMNELVQKYRASGLEIVAVNVDKKRQDAERFLARIPAAFTVVYDPAGGTAAAWRITSMPSSYLIDAQGKVTFVEAGFRDERKAEVEGRIRKALELD